MFHILHKLTKNKKLIFTIFVQKIKKIRRCETNKKKKKKIALNCSVNNTLLHYTKRRFRVLGMKWKDLLNRIKRRFKSSNLIVFSKL